MRDVMRGFWRHWVRTSLPMKPVLPVMMIFMFWVVGGLVGGLVVGLGVDWVGEERVRRYDWE